MPSPHVSAKKAGFTTPAHWSERYIFFIFCAVKQH
jgi:hypothetical protein